MGKFIYVYNTEARDKLIKAGMKLLQSDERNHTFVFLDDDDKNYDFALNDISFIRSNTLTF